MTPPSSPREIFLKQHGLDPSRPVIAILPGSRSNELIKDLEEVVFKAGTTVIDKERDANRTHLSDALGYLVWQECHSSVKFGEQPRRLL